MRVRNLLAKKGIKFEREREREIGKERGCIPEKI